MNRPANAYRNQPRAVAISLPVPVSFEEIMRDRIVAIRDTLISLGLQIVFRATTFLRHLNW